MALQRSQKEMQCSRFDLYGIIRIFSYIFMYFAANVHTNALLRERNFGEDGHNGQ
jgi:hypothetical protein